MEEWKGSMPILLPIIGKYAGSLCEDKSFVVVEMNPETQLYEEILKRKKVVNYLQFEMKKGKIGRNIYVKHEAYVSYNRNLWRKRQNLKN